jgi:hypothetical protein
MTIRSFQLIMLFAIFFVQSHSQAAAAQPVPATTLSANEHYLGAIPYQGGLLERGRLELSDVAVLKYLRFEVPSHCKADIFEAGTTTEGVDDLAERTRTAHVFSVNEGRGIRARSVFLSLNGAEAQNCHVLVFSRQVLDLPPPPSDPSPPNASAITCIENSLSFPIITQLHVGTDNRQVSQVLFQPQRTSILNHAVGSEGGLPSISMVFDRDLSTNTVIANYALAATRSPYLDCAFAPRYRFVSIFGTSLIELVRVY